MSVTPVLWVIIPIQLVILFIVIRFCFIIGKCKVRVESITEFIASPDYDEKSDKSDIIGKVITVVKSHESKGKTLTYDDLSDLIYNELTKNDSFIRALINSEVILGLSGTFLGLIIALSNINPAEISHNLSAGDFISTMIEQMNPFLKGLSIAFGASFSGILCMLVGNLVYSYTSRARGKNINDFLFVISSELLPSLASAKPEEKIYQSVDHFSEKVEQLTEKIRESLFDFNSRFEVLIKKTTDSFNNTLDKILDENKIALNSQIVNLQTSANYLMEIKNEMVNTTGTITKASEKQFTEITKMQKRIDEGNDQLLKKIQEYVDSQSKLVGLFDGAETKQSEMINCYSEHFEKLQQLGEQVRSIIIQVSESLNGMLEKTNKQIEEHFNSISKEYDKRLLEAVSIFNSKSSEVFDKFDNNSVRLDELINQTGRNAEKLENTLYLSLGQINEGIKNNLDILSTSFKENLSQLGKLNEQFPEFLKGMEANNSQIKTTIGGFDSIIGKFETIIQNNIAKYFETIEKVTNELDIHYARMQKEYGRIISNIDSFNRSHSFTADLINEFKKSVELTLKPINEFTQAAQEVRRLFDEFENEFLKKQEELFIKISEQKDIPVNLVMGGDGSKSLKSKGKIFNLRDDRRKSLLKDDIKPLTPPPGYFDKENRKAKENFRSKKYKGHVHKEVEPKVRVQNKVTKFLLKIFGIEQEMSFPEDSLSNGSQDTVGKKEIEDDEKNGKEDEKNPE